MGETEAFYLLNPNLPEATILTRHNGFNIYNTLFNSHVVTKIVYYLVNTETSVQRDYKFYFGESQ